MRSVGSFMEVSLDVYRAVFGMLPPFIFLAGDATLRRHYNLVPITVPHYNGKADWHPFGTLIGITSES